MRSPLCVLPDLSERLNYNFDDFSLYVRRDELSRYGYEALCHWHPDLEFIYIEKGSMDYFVNGKVFRLHQGQGIFVNSRRLHYGYSREKLDCTFLALVIHPVLFEQSSEAVRKFVEKKFGFDNEDAILLRPEESEEKLILDQMQELQKLAKGFAENPLRLLAAAISVCANAANLVESVPQTEHDRRMQEAFLSMTDFIRRHYAEKLSLDRIADAGAVCRSRSCQLFRRFSGQSPNAYLTKYRLTKSMELLRDTDLTVTEIALLCGFQTPGYYICVFRRETGQTPLHYRRAVNAICY